MSTSHLPKKMSVAHEERVSEKLGLRRSPSSGAQFNDQMDGRSSKYHESIPLAMEAKATRARSISITRAVWDKAVEQSQGEITILALCMFDDDRLKNYLGLIALAEDDFVEIKAKAEAACEARELLTCFLEGRMPKGLDYEIEEVLDHFRSALQ